MAGHTVGSRRDGPGGNTGLHVHWLGHSFIRRLGETNYTEDYTGTDCAFTHTFDGQGGLTMEKFLQRQLFIPGSHAIVLDILTNSLCAKKCTAEVALELLHECVSSIRSRIGKDCPVFIPQVTPRGPAGMRPGQETLVDFNNKVEKVNVALSKLNWPNVHFVRLHGYRRQRYLMPDGVHLTKPGLKRYCIIIMCSVKRITKPSS